MYDFIKHEININLCITLIEFLTRLLNIEPDRINIQANILIFINIKEINYYIAIQTIVTYVSL